MSRDGYLPPGCTERDVDMSAPDYWDVNDHLEEQRYLINLERDRLTFEAAFDRLREEFNDVEWLRTRLKEFSESL